MSFYEDKWPYIYSDGMLGRKKRKARAPGEPGPNDHHVAFDGGVRGGLEADLAELQEHRETLDEKINAKLLEGCPMLKGTGFIVIDPGAPRFEEELPDKADAEAIASHIAHTSRVGTAIIYAPIAVLRPERPVVTSTPSKLLQQVLGNSGKQIAGAADADAEVKG